MTRKNALLSPQKPPFIIAEMSGNHNGSLARALRIVEAAARAGVDSIKFQTYTAHTITLDCDRPDFRIDDPKSLWNGRGLFDLYQEAHTPWEWHAELFLAARRLGLVPFSTPFDATAVDFLEETVCPELYKIASFELTHLPLIAKVAATGKPIIMSAGMATKKEIAEALRTARTAGCADITLLKCTSAYPADASDANLMTMKDMAERFKVKIGLSDHTLGIGTSLAAVAMGAVAVEKHFTLCRAEGGVDSAFSLEPEEMRLLKTESERAWRARGKVVYGGTENEKNSRPFRQSVWPTRAIKAGEVLKAEDLKICRPGLSLPPRDYGRILGKIAAHDIARGERLVLADFRSPGAKRSTK